MSPIEKRLEGKCEKVTSYITSVTLQELRQYCLDQKATLGYVVDKAVLEYIERHKND